MEKEEYKKLFIGGDLTGIQKFLYNISSQKAAVSLKGRSSYLSDFMDRKCEAVLEAVQQAGAKDVHQIYCSGGKFYIITDLKEGVVDAIEHCANVIQQQLWEEHHGELNLNIGYLPFTENSGGSVDADGQKDVKPGILWEIVNAQFAHKKNMKFKHLLQSHFPDLFSPIAVGGTPHICAVTGIESDQCVKIPDEDEEIYVLPSVKYQIDQGRKLNASDHAKEFEEYARDSYLGVLRMDVDNLGTRLTKGFDSIQAYEKFSERLCDFFEKRLKDIRKEDEFESFINIIYAGGDDIFVVGRWDKTIDFAERVHRELNQKFRADNLSISGGVVIVKPKYPISKAAEQAGEAEDAAKNFEYKGEKKNAFHLLGKTVSWTQEFDEVKALKEQFVKLINDNGLSKGLLHKLMLYASIAEQNKIRERDGKTPDYSYIWHLPYYLTRYIKRYEGYPDVKSFCIELRDQRIDFKNTRSLELIALAARWAELTLKKTDKEVNNP